MQLRSIIIITVPYVESSVRCSDMHKRQSISQTAFSLRKFVSSSTESSNLDARTMHNAFFSIKIVMNKSAFVVWRQFLRRAPIIRRRRWIIKTNICSFRICVNAKTYAFAGFHFSCDAFVGCHRRCLVQKTEDTRQIRTILIAKIRHDKLLQLRKSWLIYIQYMYEKMQWQFQHIKCAHKMKWMNWSFLCSTLLRSKLQI